MFNGISVFLSTFLFCHVFSGVAVGMGMVSMQNIADVGQTLREKGYRRVSPHFLPMVLINMPAGHISLKFGLQVGSVYLILCLLT